MPAKVKYIGTIVTIIVLFLFGTPSIIAALYILAAKAIMFVSSYTFQPGDVAQGLVIVTIISGLVGAVAAIASTVHYIDNYERNRRNNCRCR